MTSEQIITIKELIGRTIVNATIWSDKENMSLELDNGSILQIAVTDGDSLNWEVEIRIKASTE
jgi:hypothetical protein